MNAIMNQTLIMNAQEQSDANITSRDTKSAVTLDSNQSQQMLLAMAQWPYLKPLVM